MPNCFQLNRKSDGQAELLQEVDRKMCEHFQVPCDPDKWYQEWYNTIGFSLAMGRTFDELRVRYTGHINDQTKTEEHREYARLDLAIVNWLDEHYTMDTWAEVGRRR